MDNELKLAKRLYSAYSGNDKNVHCNHFAAWQELSQGKKDQWIATAKAVATPPLAADKIEIVSAIVGKHIYGEKRADTYTHVTKPCAEEILEALQPPKPVEGRDVTEGDDAREILGHFQAVQNLLDKAHWSKNAEAFEPAIDRELATKLIHQILSLWESPAGSTASGYGMTGLHQLLGIDPLRQADLQTMHEILRILDTADWYCNNPALEDEMEGAIQSARKANSQTSLQTKLDAAKEALREIEKTEFQKGSSLHWCINQLQDTAREALALIDE